MHLTGVAGVWCSVRGDKAAARAEADLDFVLLECVPDNGKSVVASAETLRAEKATAQA